MINNIKKHIKRIKLSENLVTRGLTFLPPLLGIVVFTYLVRYSGIASVLIRVPIFQGVTSYFSLILLGFTYVKGRENVSGNKIIPILLGVVLFPIVFYVYNDVDFIFTLLLVLIQFWFLIINYTMIIKGNINNYLFLASLNSLILPLTLALSVLYLFIICMLFFVLMLYFLSSLKGQLHEFRYSKEGVSIIKSILLQSPLIILPFFDFRIAVLIGVENYSNYVLLYKYINGIVVLLFSYKQLNLAFYGNLKRKHLIFYQLILILIILIGCSFYENNWLFAFSIVLFSYGVNLSSLLIRSTLFEGVSIIKTFVGPISVFIYILIIFSFDELIIISHNSFIIFMFMTSFITAISIKLMKSKNIFV